MFHSYGELIDDIGYRALTTTRIAEHAKVPIGSLYQLPADKHDLANALAAHDELTISYSTARR